MDVKVGQRWQHEGGEVYRVQSVGPGDGCILYSESTQADCAWHQSYLTEHHADKWSLIGSEYAAPKPPPPPIGQCLGCSWLRRSSADESASKR